jgi:hypothetical protein
MNGKMMTDEFGGWVKTADRMPQTGEIVLAAYRTKSGNWRLICAKWLPGYSQYAHPEYEDAETEYDEATDTYYTPEGWYEQIDNCDDYTGLFVYQGEPSHWMPLPPPPEND